MVTACQLADGHGLWHSRVDVHSARMLLNFLPLQASAFDAVFDSAIAAHVDTL